MSQFVKRLVIFNSALFVRSIVGYIFYGSIDVSAFIGINAHTFNNTLVLYPPAIWCSFPTIPFYLWFCGFISIYTSLPLAFCFKIIPIFFDALLAVLLYDIIRNVRTNHAFTIGMLYALSPVSIIITCIHGQWESLPLYFFMFALYVRTCFVASYLSFFIYGALFACAFMLKPMPIIFSLFFFVPWPLFKEHLGVWWLYVRWLLGLLVVVFIGGFFVLKYNKTLSLDALVKNISVPWALLVAMLFVVAASLILMRSKQWATISPAFKHYISLHGAALAGLCSIVLFCFVGFNFYGFNVLLIIDKVLRYFNQGIYVFGLPCAWPFSQGFFAVVLKNRIWIMSIILVFVYLYYKGKFDIYYGILCSLMLILGVSGLSPQYLLWALPFLLVTSFYRTVAIFNVVCSVFFVLYYMNPLTNSEVPYQSMLSFTALRHFVRLMPPSFLTHERFLLPIHLLGNYLLPLICLSVICVVMIMMWYNCPLFISCRHNKFFIVRNIYVIAPFVLTMGIFLVMMVSDTTGWGQAFNRIIAQNLNQYATVVINQWVSGDFGEYHAGNICCLLALLTVFWSCVVWRIRDRIW